MSRVRSAIVLIVFFTASGYAAAQTIAMTGRVADSQGGAVVGAGVTVSGANSPAQTTRTAADGTFQFPEVSAGPRMLTVEAPGFLRWSQQITAGPEPVSVVLQVAGISEDITVAGSAEPNMTRPAPTGSRLGLTPLETPASVHVISGEEVRERGDMTLTEANTRTPGVTSQWTVGNGGGGLSARGFTTVNSILQLFDGVQLLVGAGTVTFPFDTWNIDRIETLGGPGSVLYGTGAIGGVVNVVPRKPNPVAFENSARLTFGSNNTWRAALDSAGPVNERLSYRFDVSHANSDGWVERGQSNSTVVSGSIRQVISPSLTLSLSEDYGYQRPMNYYGAPTVNLALDKSLRRKNYNLADAATYFKDNWTQAKLDWNPSARLSMRTIGYYLSAYRQWHRIGTYVFQPQTSTILRSNVAEVFHNQKQYGAHSDIVVRNRIGGQDNTFSAGFDYNFVQFKHTNNSPSTGTSSVSLANPSPGQFVDLALVKTVPAYFSHTRAGAVFLEDRQTLGQRFSLVGGLRFDRTHADRDDLILVTRSSRTFKPVSARGGAVVSLTPKLVLYGQYSSAVDSIGNIISLSAVQQIFDLSDGQQVEVGAKQSFMGGRGEWTVATYRIVKHKLLVPDPNNTLLSIQVGAQSSRGVEGSVSFAVARALRVEANGALVKARYDDFTEVIGGVINSRNGNTPFNVPRWAGNLWVTWNPDADWQVTGAVRGVASRFVNTANTWVMPSYTVVDAGLKKRLSPRLVAEARLYNAADDIYALNFWNGNTTQPQWILGAPRRAELTLTASF